jgi:hypothetical protein
MSSELSSYPSSSYQSISYTSGSFEPPPDTGDALDLLSDDDYGPLPSEVEVIAADPEPTETELLQQILRRLGGIEARLENLENRIQN